MRALFLVFALFGGVLATACGDTATSPREPAFNVTPQQFAILPCGDLGELRPCALIAAGGKRILFGAPGSVAAGLKPDDLSQLDAVLLFSLRSYDVEGLDDIRNRSWDAGRDTPLLVIGPSGTETFVAAINKAYEQADALRIVEDGIPPGGYDAAVLTPLEAQSGQTVFNTGDVVVKSVGDGYTVTYLDQHSLYLSACDAEISAEVDLTVSCAADGADMAWPIKQPVLVSDG